MNSSKLVVQRDVLLIANQNLHIRVIFRIPSTEFNFPLFKYSILKSSGFRNILKFSVKNNTWKMILIFVC